MQPDIRPHRRHIFDGDATLGRARQSCGRPAGHYADLFAQPLHFHVPEWFRSQIVGNLWTHHRPINADDDSFDRICSRGMAIFAVNQLCRLDGHSAPHILVHFNHVRFEVSGFRILPLQSQNLRGIIYLGHSLHFSGSPDDDGLAANRGHIGFLFSEGKEILPFPLGRFVERARQTGSAMSPFED